MQTLPYSKATKQAQKLANQQNGDFLDHDTLETSNLGAEGICSRDQFIKWQAFGSNYTKRRFTVHVYGDKFPTSQTSENYSRNAPRVTAKFERLSLLFQRRHSPESSSRLLSCRRDVYLTRLIPNRSLDTDGRGWQGIAGRMPSKERVKGGRELCEKIIYKWQRLGYSFNQVAYRRDGCAGKACVRCRDGEPGWVRSGFW